MTYSEYRSKAVKTLWTKYSLDVVCRHPAFSNHRIDNICANFWRCNQRELNFQCILELEEYIVNICMAVPK